MLSTDKGTYYPEVTATGAALDGLLFIAQTMCESEFGAGRALDLVSRTDIVEVYASSRTCILRALPIGAITTVEIRYPMQEWSVVEASDYYLDSNIGQINFKSLANENRASQYGRSSGKREAKITYTSGFDFVANTSQEVKNIKAICGRIVSYMNLGAGIGITSDTPVAGFRSFASADNFIGLFTAQLTKYKLRG